MMFCNLTISTIKAFAWLFHRPTDLLRTYVLVSCLMMSIVVVAGEESGESSPSVWKDIVVASSSGEYFVKIYAGPASSAELYRAGGWRDTAIGGFMVLSSRNKFFLLDADPPVLVEIESEYRGC